MLLIVADSFAASSQTPTFAEKCARAQAWSRLLRPIIPEDRLQDAFDYAFATHKTNFAVSAYDMKAAWNEIADREERAAADALALEKEINRVINCRQRALHIDADGLVNYCNPMNFNEDVAFPCDSCQPKAHTAARERFIQKHGAPAHALQMLAEAGNITEFKQ